MYSDWRLLPRLLPQKTVLGLLCHIILIVFNFPFSNEMSTIKFFDDMTVCEASKWHDTIKLQAHTYNLSVAQW